MNVFYISIDETKLGEKVFDKINIKSNGSPPSPSHNEKPIILYYYSVFHPAVRYQNL